MVLILQHGAGYTALSFSLLVKELASLRPDLAIIAIDMRAHGQSTGSAVDLSLETLLADFVIIVESLRSQWTVAHQMLLVGHSLGGSIVTHVAKRKLLGSDVVGIVVIDIVEEAAIRALVAMPQILASRPHSFPTIHDAICWAYRQKICRSLEAAAISIPSQLIQTSTSEGGDWIWRVNLLHCRQHWEGWFKGLSEEFVICETPRLLVLAEREYLDKPLMIASMQGKFQCASSVVPDTPFRKIDLRSWPRWSSLL